MWGCKGLHRTLQERVDRPRMKSLQNKACIEVSIRTLPLRSVVCETCAASDLSAAPDECGDLMHRDWGKSHVCRDRTITMHVHSSARTAPEGPALQPYSNVIVCSWWRRPNPSRNEDAMLPDSWSAWTDFVSRHEGNDVITLMSRWLFASGWAIGCICRHEERGLIAQDILKRWDDDTCGCAGYAVDSTSVASACSPVFIMSRAWDLEKSTTQLQSSSQQSQTMLAASNAPELRVKQACRV